MIFSWAGEAVFWKLRGEDGTVCTPIELMECIAEAIHDETGIKIKVEVISSTGHVAEVPDSLKGRSVRLFAWRNSNARAKAEKAFVWIKKDASFLLFGIEEKAPDKVMRIGGILLSSERDFPRDIGHERVVPVASFFIQHLYPYRRDPVSFEGWKLDMIQRIGSRLDPWTQVVGWVHAILVLCSMLVIAAFGLLGDTLLVLFLFLRRATKVASGGQDMTLAKAMCLIPKFCAAEDPRGSMQSYLTGVYDRAQSAKRQEVDDAAREALHLEQQEALSLLRLIRKTAVDLTDCNYGIRKITEADEVCCDPNFRIEIRLRRLRRIFEEIQVALHAQTCDRFDLKTVYQPRVMAPSPKGTVKAGKSRANFESPVGVEGEVDIYRHLDLSDLGVSIPDDPVFRAILKVILIEMIRTRNIRGSYKGKPEIRRRVKAKAMLADTRYSHRAFEAVWSWVCKSGVVTRRHGHTYSLQVGSPSGSDTSLRDLHERVAQFARWFKEVVEG